MTAIARRMAGREIHRPALGIKRSPSEGRDPRDQQDAAIFRRYEPCELRSIDY